MLWSYFLSVIYKRICNVSLASNVVLTGSVSELLQQPFCFQVNPSITLRSLSPVSCNPTIKSIGNLTGCSFVACCL